MNLMDTWLKQATDMLGQSAADHFGTLAQAVPSDVLGKGLASMFRSNETAPFASMVGQLFGQSDAHQQAGLLNQLLAQAGPALLSSPAGEVLGRLVGTGQTQLTPEQASQLSAAEVEKIAAQAEQVNPGVVDAVGHFYAAHATLIKALGGVALSVVLARLREHQQT